MAFDAPIASATFFYVHGFGFAPGTSTAFDSDGNAIATVTSRAATSFAAAANFVTLASGTAIVRIGFSSGVVDNFTFTLAAVATPTPSPTTTPTMAPTTTVLPTPVPCTGDCNEDAEVTIDELIVGVNLALGNALLSECPRFDGNADGTVTIDELVTAVNAALNGCPLGRGGSRPAAQVAAIRERYFRHRLCRTRGDCGHRPPGASEGGECRTVVS